MSEFWETAFIDKKEMWWSKPADAAILAKNFFLEKGVKNILIPGIGYGRNAQPFREHGISVTGIEISKTAIEIGEKHYETDMTIYHGSVCDMPFDNKQYDGIFCYALIHLLDEHERTKLIQDCYNQLVDGGYMIFVAVSKEAATYGKGTYISPDRYEIHKGVKMYFYDKENIYTEFSAYGLQEITTITERFPFYIITCQKTT